MSYAPIGSEIILQNGDVAGQRGNTNSYSNPFSSKTRFSKNGGRRAGGAPRRPRRRAPQSDPPLLVHCHLCWDWVWQRPQQFISRLSARHPVLFVETIGPDPQLSSPMARFWTPQDYPNVTILRLQFPCWRWSDGDYVDRERRRLVREFLKGPGAGRFENPVQWFYDPMAVTAFAGRMREILTVYDCMDELSKFAEAPPEVITRERELLQRADVAFAGGRRLWEAKKAHNSNCHFYGCGVDLEHFGKARLARTEVPADLAAVKRPTLGYFGVVDERMDFELVEKLAAANPGWSIVMVGPSLKVRDVPLPRRANIHWLGKKDYAQLPHYCKGFDVCLMPFALNAATEFINPTKALEYMAAGKPVVSTAVPDVVRNFGQVVKIAASHEEFIALSRKEAQAPDAAAVERGLKLAAENSWDSIVTRLENHVQEALLKKRAAGAIA